MEGLNSSIIKNLFLFLPPLDEQRVIAAFLDRETTRIDKLITKKERQIELLQEKRSTLIIHAVTKGLNPKAKMKDSGIEWLGKIPAQWEVRRFKYVMLLQRGHDLPSEQFIEGDYPVCASNGIIGYHNEFTTVGPSITVGRSGSVGEVNYVETNFWAHNTALYVKKFLKAQPRYAYYLLKALDVKYLSEGTAVGTLNRNYIHDLIIPLPSLNDQTEIVEYLDHEIKRIDLMTERIRVSIDKLQEYRVSLISAAVTGRIDVREEVA
jgi:type I restriction enzyme S subunit